jgi:hypothetical protein
VQVRDARQCNAQLHDSRSSSDLGQWGVIQYDLMLVVRLERWPDGDESRSEDLGRAVLSPIGAEDDTANYEMIVCDRGVPVVKTWVDAHRKKHGAWELVRLAFSAIGSRIRTADEVSKETP